LLQAELVVAEVSAQDIECLRHDDIVILLIGSL